MSEKPREPYRAGTELLRPRQISMQIDALAWAEVHEMIVREILANFGRHFHNHDQGHSVYVAGAEDGSLSPFGEDSPQQNGLFQLLVQTSKELGDGDLIRYRITNWQDFCRLVVEGYDRSHGIEPRFPFKK